MPRCPRRPPEVRRAEPSRLRPPPAGARRLAAGVACSLEGPWDTDHPLLVSFLRVSLAHGKLRLKPGFPAAKTSGLLSGEVRQILRPFLLGSLLACLQAMTNS